MCNNKLTKMQRKQSLFVKNALKVRKKRVALCYKKKKKKVIDNKFLPNATNAESKVFFYKMKGDAHRYMAEAVPKDR